MCVLLLIFSISTIINVRALSDINKINESITSCYLNLEEKQGNVAVAFQQVQLYANLSYYKVGTGEEEIIQGKLGTAIETLRTGITEMEPLCIQTGNSDLIAAFTSWKDACLTSLLLVIIIFAVIMLLVRKTIANPAKNFGKVIGELIDKIERAEGDLMLRVPVTTSDEAGQLSAGINTFVENLQNLVKTLKNQSEGLLDSALKVTNDLSKSNESACNISAAMEQMSAGMEEISATVSRIASGSDNVLAEVRSMNSNVNEGADLIKTIKQRAGEMHQSTLAVRLLLR